MNWKRLLLAALIVLIAQFVLDYIFHVGILGSTYTALSQAGIFSAEATISSLCWVSIITMIVFSFFFVFIFVRGYESRGIMEGVRYGIYMALFVGFVGSFNMFVWFGVPYWLTWSWIAIYFVEFIIFGIIAALIYKPKAGA